MYIIYMSTLDDWHYKWEISTCFNLNIVVGGRFTLPSDVKNDLIVTNLCMIYIGTKIT